MFSWFYGHYPGFLVSGHGSLPARRGQYHRLPVSELFLAIRPQVPQLLEPIRSAYMARGRKSKHPCKHSRLSMLSTFLKIIL